MHFRINFFLVSSLSTLEIVQKRAVINKPVTSSPSARRLLRTPFPFRFTFSLFSQRIVSIQDIYLVVTKSSYFAFRNLSFSFRLLYVTKLSSTQGTGTYGDKTCTYSDLQVDFCIYSWLFFYSKQTRQEENERMKRDELIAFKN